MALTRIKFNQVSTNTASFDDPLLLLNKSQTGTNDKDSGFVVERGDGINVAFIWDESAGEFATVTTTDTGATSGNVPITAYANLKVNDLSVTGTVGNLTIAGNITPTTDITYDLGSPSTLVLVLSMLMDKKFYRTIVEQLLSLRTQIKILE